MTWNTFSRKSEPKPSKLPLESSEGGPNPTQLTTCYHILTHISILQTRLHQKHVKNQKHQPPTHWNSNVPTKKNLSISHGPLLLPWIQRMEKRQKRPGKSWMGSLRNAQARVCLEQLDLKKLHAKIHGVVGWLVELKELYIYRKFRQVS